MELAPGVEVEPLANGVDTTFFRRVEAALPPGDRLRIVVPRRLFPKNGVEYFIRAFPLILKEVDAEAILIGDGPERARLEALRRNWASLSHITFLGKRAHSEMPGLLSSGRCGGHPLPHGGHLGRCVGSHGLRAPCGGLRRGRPS